MTMGKEEHVVEAALAWLEAERSGSAAQLHEAEDNLRERLESLKVHDANREKPRWTKPRRVRTLGLKEVLK